jgi:hypothetical protein
MSFRFARVGAALGEKAEDVFMRNRRLWVRLHEKSGTLEKAAQMANHASTRTTQLYDRRREELIRRLTPLLPTLTRPPAQAERTLGRS